MTPPQSIGIVGCGVVGKAIARSYLEYAQHVYTYDKVPERGTHSLHQTLKANLVFVCLPETVLEGFAKLLDFDYPAHHLVIKSTVQVGTTRWICNKHNLDMIHSPEFLTERCAATDALLPARNIIGSPFFQGGCCGEAAALLRELYRMRFPGVKILEMVSEESELVKLFVNAFFATKVSFFNEIHQLATLHQLNWNRILHGMMTDGRIAHSHTSVPGPDGKYGFGGKCLPKDLETLLGAFAEKELEASICQAVHSRNYHDRQRGAQG